MVVILAQQSFNAGTHLTPATASNILPDGNVTVTAIMNAADQTDTTLQLTLGLQGNDAAGAPANDPDWYPIAETTWQGGTSPKTGQPLPPPSVSWNSSVVTAQSVRGMLTNNKRVSIGLDEVIS